MKLIIDIPNYNLNAVQNGSIACGQILKAVQNGTSYETRPQGEWVLVGERLPEEKINPYTNDFDEVLCTTDWGEVQAYKYGTPIIHHKPHFWLGGAIMDEHIIAWQYKPEPYKESGEEE